MIRWIVAEIPERDAPGVWIVAETDCVVQSSVRGEGWSRVGVAYAGCVIEVVEWPVVVATAPLRSSALGATVAVVGDEVLGFSSARLVGEGRYELGGLRRGLRGTAASDKLTGLLGGVLDGCALFVEARRAVRAPSSWRLVPDSEEALVQTVLDVRLRGLVRPRVVHGAARFGMPLEERWGARSVEDLASPVVACWLDERHEAEAGIGSFLWDSDVKVVRFWTGSFWARSV